MAAAGYSGNLVINPCYGRQATSWPTVGTGLSWRGMAVSGGGHHIYVVTETSGIYKYTTELTYDGAYAMEAARISTINANAIGIGTVNPVYRLQLSTDSAAKPTTNTWTVSSDERVKKNIVPADTNICYSTLRTIPLRYFEWDPEYYGPTVTPDRHSLGFIAQEIKPLFPKAVDIIPEYQNLSSFHTLNVDQIYKAHVGATQQLMAVVEAQQSTIAWLTERVAELLARPTN
jgi:hypothetical protein